MRATSRARFNFRRQPMTTANPRISSRAPATASKSQMLDVVLVVSVSLLLRSMLEEVGDSVENRMFEFDGAASVVVCGGGVVDADKAKTAGPPAEDYVGFKEIGVND